MRSYKSYDDRTKQILLDDHFNWDAQISRIPSDELTPLEIAHTTKSFEFLRKKLGENFPRECFENDNAINSYFINRAPWTRIWFNWLGDALLEIGMLTDVESIIGKLKSHREGDFFEARSILEVGFKFAKAGLGIQIENISLNDKGNLKKPDLTISNKLTGERGLVEITRLTKNPLGIKYESFMQKIFFTGLDMNIPLAFAGGLLKNLSDEHLEELNIELDQKMRKCFQFKTFQSLSHEGIIDLGFAPENDPTLMIWVESKGYDLNTFVFPETDILGRVRGKIIHKKDQLSSDTPSVLVIRNEDFFVTAASFKSIHDGLMETIHKCPQLLAVVLISGEMGNSEKIVATSGLSFYVERKERHAYSTKTIILFNRFCKTKISPHMLMRIFDAFEQH